MCAILDDTGAMMMAKKYAEQIVYVTDRPGHDRVMQLSCSKDRAKLGWT
jgi:dTDP-glucose 4,6-dehydratase